MTTHSIRRLAIVASLAASAIVGGQAMAQNTSPTVPKPTDPKPANPVTTSGAPAASNTAGQVGNPSRNDMSMSNKGANPSSDAPKR